MGLFVMHITGELRTDAEVWAGNRYEVEINVRLASETQFSTWYRGIIENLRLTRTGGGMQIELEGASYINELRKVHIDTNFVAGTTVRAIVESLLDNSIVGANSRVLKNTGKLITAGASYTTLGVMTFEISAFDSMKLLAELQGGIQYGIDSLREFYFLANPSTTSEQQYIVGKDLVDPIRSSRNWENFNAIAS